MQKVEKDGLTIKDAAKELDINYSTAKHIMKVFRQTGEVETKIMMKRKTKDTGNAEVFSECNNDFVPQVSQKQIQELQPTSFSTGYCNCQLPISANMQDADFVPEQFSDEEKFYLQNFFMGSN